MSALEVNVRTEAYRKCFPVTKKLIYLNHAAVAPLSTRIVEAINRYLIERSETDVENYVATLMPSLSAARRLVSRHIGCAERNLGFVPNTSYALNFLAQGLEWKQGDRILLGSQEFPTNVYPFLNLVSKGVEIDFAEGEDGAVTVEEIERRLTPRTKLVAVSYVQFLSGYRIDLKTLAGVCHKHGALLSVDAIQALGAMPIDCRETGIDFLAAGCHKWAMSPMGIAALYLTDDLLERLRPAYVGWLSVKDAWNMLDYKLDLMDDATRFELGTQNWLGIIGLCEAFKLFAEVGAETVTEKVLSLTQHLRTSLQACGFEVAGATDREHWSGITAVKHLTDAPAAAEALMRAGIEATARCGMLRVSPHFYNTADELNALVGELQHLSRR